MTSPRHRHGNPATIVTPTPPCPGATPASRRTQRRVNQAQRRRVMSDILHRVGIKASSKEVYEALATRDGLARWWTTNTQGDSKVGGAIKFRFSADGREIGGFDMKVLELRAGERVGWEVIEG